MNGAMMFQQSTEIHELAAALAKVQAQIKPAVKDTANLFFKSKYADLSSVWDACRIPLTENGLSVVQMPVEAGAGRVGLCTMLLHTSGQYLSSTVSTPLVKDDPQGVGSALTYLRRYSLAAMVGIVADVDDDGNAASAPPQRQPPRGASYQPPAPRDNTAKLRERIGILSAEAQELGVPLPDVRPPAQMTAEELTAHGKALRQAIDVARQKTPESAL